MNKCSRFRYGVLAFLLTFPLAIGAKAAGPGEACVSHTECTDASAAKCVNSGGSSPKTCQPCTSHGHCASVEGLRFCQSSSCVECRNDLHCAAAAAGQFFDGCIDNACSYISDIDDDGTPDREDPDADGDGLTNGSDLDPLDALVCSDLDGDGCDDCAQGAGQSVLNDGLDTDGDGRCNTGDTDDDNDSILDTIDAAPLDDRICQDLDGDQCDDCSRGLPNVANDGQDSDGDGLCDLGDTDDDNDGVADVVDNDDFNPRLCHDLDGDGCDDCSLGEGPNVTLDGLDSDGDGLCDAGDGDDDNDGFSDTVDSAPLDAYLCADLDKDGCDDCSSGVVDIFDDGSDSDSDGLCDLGDTDSDNDGVDDLMDVAPTDPARCDDVDDDGCDDCALGNGSAPEADGSDYDRDGMCDLGDTDDDNDGVPDGLDTDPLDARVCGDEDGDSCDDCSFGEGAQPDSDGLDTDGDGLCDLGDLDDDGDGVLDVDDPAPTEARYCGDSDNDLCDDCSRGEGYEPKYDGVDTNKDGICDAIDQDDDGDLVPDAEDLEPLDPFICRDADDDGCDDCASGAGADPRNDGPDEDGDGVCDEGEVGTTVLLDAGVSSTDAGDAAVRVSLSPIDLEAEPETQADVFDAGPVILPPDAGLAALDSAVRANATPQEVVETKQPVLADAGGGGVPVEDSNRTITNSLLADGGNTPVKVKGSDGCGCRIVSHRGASGKGLTLLALLAFALARRVRRKGRS